MKKNWHADDADRAYFHKQDFFQVYVLIIHNKKCNLWILRSGPTEGNQGLINR